MLYLVANTLKLSLADRNSVNSTDIHKLNLNLNFIVVLCQSVRHKLRDTGRAVVTLQNIF